MKHKISLFRMKILYVLPISSCAFTFIINTAVIRNDGLILPLPLFCSLQLGRGFTYCG